MQGGKMQGDKIWRANLLVIYNELNFNPNVIGTKSRSYQDCRKIFLEKNSYWGRVYCIESNRQNSFNSRKDQTT